MRVSGGIRVDASLCPFYFCHYFGILPGRILPLYFLFIIIYIIYLIQESVCGHAHFNTLSEHTKVITGSIGRTGNRTDNWSALIAGLKMSLNRCELVKTRVNRENWKKPTIFLNRRFNFILYFFLF